MSLATIQRPISASGLVNALRATDSATRMDAIRDIGKSKDEAYVTLLYDISLHDGDSFVQREAVSSIGRMRSTNTIPYLTNLLSHKDPKVVCQAIRGLLVFKGTKEVDDCLRELQGHPNEMVQAIINQEYFKESERQIHRNNAISSQRLKDIVVHGDVEEILPLILDETIHLTFTSPPYYNARDYSIYESYTAYLEFLERVFQQVFRVTKEGRFLVVNTSPVIEPRISRSHASKRYPIPFDLHSYLVRMGWDFIDDIVWLKPEYSVKNRVGGFMQHRTPLAYKPNAVTEYLMVYRKHTDKLIDWNIHQYDKRVVEDSKVGDDFETTNVWSIAPKSDKVHSAIFPMELCKRVIEYYSFVGDIIFDPFAGSGTVGKTARMLNRSFLLTEKEARYFEYIKDNLSEGILFGNSTATFMEREEFIKRME